MYIAVCDDQANDLDVLTSLLHRWQRERGTALQFKTFRSAAEMLDAAEKEPFTLYLLDVMMPGTNGMTAAKEIRSFDDAAEIVFLSSSPEFAYESYGVRAFDYLLKPIGKEPFFAILDKLSLKEQRPWEGLTLKCGAAMIRIPFSQLVYVEVNGKHLYFNLTDKTQREVYGAMKEYAPILLTRPEFLQIHRSYIVNLYQIAQLSPAGIWTFSGEHLPVSRRLYSQLQKNYMKLLFTTRGE